MNGASSPLSTEKITIRPFHRVDIRGSGTVAFVSGNAPWLWLEEGKDLIRLDMGASLMTGQTQMGGPIVTLHNPFSFEVTAYIARGFPAAVSTMQPGGNISGPGWRFAGQILCRGGANLITTVAGKKKAVVMSSKRTNFWVNIGGMTAADDWEILVYRGMSWDKAALRAAGIIDTTQIPISREDGTLNTQLVAACGTFTDVTDLASWETAAGFSGTKTRTKGITNQVELLLEAGSTYVVFGADVSVWRPVIAGQELGDPVMEFRGAL